MAILQFNHCSLLQGSPRRPLRVEDLVHLFQSAATCFHSKEEPKAGVNDVESNENEVVSPIDRVESNGGDVGVVQVGNVG